MTYKNPCFFMMNNVLRDWKKMQLSNTENDTTLW